MKLNFLIACMLIGAAGYSALPLVLAADGAKASYKLVQDAADATYQVDTAKCGVLAGNGKDICIQQAKASRERSKQDAKAEYKNTPQALSTARKSEADADYAVDKEKCKGLAANVEDVCLTQAKAAQIGTVANANKQQNMSKANADVREERADARYQVALARCNALPGASKDVCITTAKTTLKK